METTRNNIIIDRLERNSIKFKEKIGAYDTFPLMRSWVVDLLDIIFNNGNKLHIIDNLAGIIDGYKYVTKHFDFPRIEDVYNHFFSLHDEYIVMYQIVGIQWMDFNMNDFTDMKKRIIVTYTTKSMEEKDVYNLKFIKRRHEFIKIEEMQL